MVSRERVKARETATESRICSAVESSAKARSPWRAYLKRFITEGTAINHQLEWGLHAISLLPQGIQRWQARGAVMMHVQKIEEDPPDNSKTPMCVSLFHWDGTEDSRRGKGLTVGISPQPRGQLEFRRKKSEGRAANLLGR